VGDGRFSEVVGERRTGVGGGAVVVAVTGVGGVAWSSNDGSGVTPIASVSVCCLQACERSAPRALYNPLDN
jgi:hypothetical protein